MSAATMSPANLVSCKESLVQYRQRVSAALVANGEEGALSLVERTTTLTSWLAGMRSDLCAALIRTDRHLTGAGRNA